MIRCPVTDVYPTIQPINVRLPNDASMKSTHKGITP